METPATQTYGTVRSLRENLEYQFRVKAVNKAGPSEPSEATRTIVVKPRHCKSV